MWFFVYFGKLRHRKLKMTITCFSKASDLEMILAIRSVQMCRGSNVKDKQVIAFQLESLILAQNERWRHA
jgi:hypothetical protein